MVVNQVHINEKTPVIKTSCTNIIDIPLEILCKVWMHISSFEDLKSISLTSRYLNNAVSVKLCRKVNVRNITAPEELSNLTQFSIHNLKLHCKINYIKPEKWNAQVTSFEHLQCLKLSGNITRGWSYYEYFKLSLLTLKELNVSGCDLNDACLAGISYLNTLQKLDISESAGVTSAGVVCLSSLKNLHDFRISYCKNIEPYALDAIAHLSLVSLHVVWCNLDDNHLVKISKFTQLTHLGKY